MAEVLEEFNFGSLRSSKRNHYEQFLDGQIWKLTSEDSASGTAALRSMQSTIANVAKNRNMKIQSNIVTETQKLQSRSDHQKGKTTRTKTIEYLVVQAIPESEES